MKIEVDACDVCGDPTRPAKVYTVSVEGRSGGTWRCSEDARELEAIVSHVTPESPVRPPTRPTERRPLKVRSIEEFEAEKVAATKKSPPARKARGSR